MRPWLFLLLLIPAISSAETIFYCMRDGRKVISDQPCADQKAREVKRIDGADLPPINTSKALSTSDRQRARDFDARQQQEDEQNRQNEAQRQNQAQQSAAASQDKAAYCDLLYRRKADIVSAQRFRSSDSLNEEHKRVNDEIYRLRCGS